MKLLLFILYSIITYKNYLKTLGLQRIYFYRNTIIIFLYLKLFIPINNILFYASVQGSAMSTTVNSRVNSRLPTRESTPMLSRRNSTTTFSTNNGLAAMLNERGIRAITPSALTTPMFSTTATPCNSPYGSPSGSPDRSRSPSPSDSPYSHPFGLPGEFH